MPDGATDLTDPLEVLGNELRLAILRELAEAERALSFSELRERVGVRDTGKFNYHLTRLCRYFVREAEDGYELGHAGSRVIAAAGDPVPGGEDGSVAGDDRVTADATVAATDGKTECPVCGEPDCGKLFHVHLDVPWW